MSGKIAEEPERLTSLLGYQESLLVTSEQYYRKIVLIDMVYGYRVTCGG
jgi:hypothetical protein